ncbi:MAG: hypothetical protein IIU30_10410, partial [Treponema sp.]|nr:hypothetical protein [Treponema sp.]
TRAAWTNSIGKLEEFCLKKNIRKAVEMLGKMKAATVFKSFRLENSLNRGIIVAAPGIIIESKRIPIKRSLYLSRKTQKP